MARLNRVALAWRLELAAFDRRERGEQIVEAGKHLIVSVLTDEELDQALAYMAQAYDDMERAGLFEHVADTLRIRAFHERHHEQKRRVA